MMPYMEWILEKISQNVPDRLIYETIKSMEWYYCDGLRLMALGDYGKDYVVYKASDENDLRIHCFIHMCKELAQRWELATRKDNQNKWRYVQACVENDRWLYIEHKRYQYNTIEDSRLDWFEKHLRLIEPVISSQLWRYYIELYTSLLNMSFQKKHWDYDRRYLRFIEISDSKKVDSNGTVKPSPSSIIRII